MNTYYKFAPNVFLAKCEEMHKKGEEILVTTKSGKYPREHAYTLTYAKKAVNEAQKNYELAKKLWGDENENQ